MRILHVASEFPPARIFGLGRYVHDLACAQVRRGHNVEVLTNSLGGRDRDAVVAGVKVRRIEFPSPPMPPDGGTQVVQFNVDLLQRWLEFGRHGPPPDVVVSHDWLTAMASEGIRRLARCRWVATMHDTVIGKTLRPLSNEDKFVAHVEAFAGRTADAVVAVSRAVLEELAAKYAVPREKMQAVAAGVSPLWFDGVPLDALADLRAILASPDEKLILYVGRLDPEKGVDVLLRALADVLARHPATRLAIAGRGSEDRALAALARELSVQDRIRFLGYVSGTALGALYRCADVLACPSLYEPFGIVPLEGMINGVPVVVSEVGGMAEIVQPERSGLRVPSGDPRALATALCRVLSDRGLAQALSDGGRARATGEYNWDRVAACLDPIYASREIGTAPNVLRGRTRLTAALRVKNAERFAHECLRHLSEFVDRIVVLDDGSTDATGGICRSFPKVSACVRWAKSWFHEGVDRNVVLALALDTEPEWILLPDADEIFEDRFLRDLPGMLARADVGLYAFPFCHFWRSRTHYRVDGKWGREMREFPIPRLVRASPSLFYPVDKPLGSAQIRGFAGRALVSHLRVKHYGHLYADLSADKVRLYSSLDPASDYSYMVDEAGLQLEEWVEDSSGRNA